MRRVKFIGFILFLLVAGFYSCFVTESVNQQNLAFLYQPSDNLLQPRFRIVHINDTVSRAYFSIPAGGLLFARSHPDQAFSAEYNVHYKVFQSYDSPLLWDSASIAFSTQGSNDDNRNIHNYFDFRADIMRNYLLLVSFADVNRKAIVSRYISVRKENAFGAQYFQVMDDAGIQITENFVKTNKEIFIVFRPSYKIQSLYVKYYAYDFPLAAPPFSTVPEKSLQVKSDSVFSIFPDADGKCKLIPHKKGIYHLQSDTAFSVGLTLLAYDNDFPVITEADQMVESVRYITSRSEYENMRLQKNRRAAIEEFWLNIAGNQDRARELIKKYYNRVQDANTLFTSYTEGWKTDRGMIYIVFGPPNVLYRTEQRETWVYGEYNNPNSLMFTFAKIRNSFSDNEYGLNRSPDFKIPFSHAVEMWRR
jgi:GWxTD domain-containing protein